MEELPDLLITLNTIEEVKEKNINSLSPIAIQVMDWYYSNYKRRRLWEFNISPNSFGPNITMDVLRDIVSSGFTVYYNEDLDYNLTIIIFKFMT